MTDGMLLLHFFRDFSQAQRKAILLELEIIPDNGAVDYKLSEAFQRQCFDRIVRGGQLEELERLVNTAMGQKISI